MPEWSKTIAETISSSIQKFDYSGYKYVINCMLIQKSDGGIQVIHCTEMVTWPVLLIVKIIGLKTRLFSDALIDAQFFVSKTQWFRVLQHAIGIKKKIVKFNSDGKINSWMFSFICMLLKLNTNLVLEISMKFQNWIANVVI